MLEFFGCQMSFELDSSQHDEVLLDLSYFCNLVLLAPVLIADGFWKRQTMLHWLLVSAPERLVKPRHGQRGH